MNYLKKIISFLLAAACTFSLEAAIPWRQKSNFQFAQNIDIKELLRDYFSLQGINISIDDDVKGTINGKFIDLSPEEFLNQIARSNSLIWFYDGNILHIYPSQKIQSRFIQMNERAAVKLLENVGHLGMVSPSSSIRVLANEGMAYVSGPPRYVEIIDDMGKTMTVGIRTRLAETMGIKIFPLKYAWAYDTTFSSMETTVTIPGVATVLRGLMETNGQDISTKVISGPMVKPRVQVSPKIDTFTQANNLEGDHNKEIPDKNLKQEPKSEIMGGATSATLIQPDIRLNAILVRDTEAKLPQYEEIIKSLDVPVQIIEIAITIVDINSNYSFSLGNNFFSAAYKGDPSRAIAIAPSGSAPTSLSGLATGFNISGTAIFDAYKIVSQINALASDGYANIVARPSVLTLNNFQAEISRISTFYVPLAGKDSSDLANVSAGTTMKVTPTVIAHENNFNQIKLLLSIDDGAVDTTSTQTTTLPQTSNNTIHTQAIINEGQSLLVGGYYRQEKGESESGIPLLRKIPLIGYVFKNKTDTVKTVERMYLITPRIVNLNYEMAPNLCPEFKTETYGIAAQSAQDNYELKYAADPELAKNPNVSPFHTGLCPQPRSGCYPIKYPID